MTIAAPIGQFVETLERAAHVASAAEDDFRRTAMSRIRALELERAFAFRRLNLVKAIVAAIAGAKDEAEAVAMGSAALLREVNWTGASKNQRDVVDRFMPVIQALRRAGDAAAEPPPTTTAAADELAAFERWYQDTRNAPFLSLMEAEVQELPLVEL